MDTARELFFEGVKNVAGKIIGAILFLALLSLFPGLKSLMKRAKNLKAGDSVGDLSEDTDSNNFGMKFLTVLVIIVLLVSAVWFIPSLRMQVVGYINAHIKRAVDNAETENSKQPETPVTEEVVNDPADAETQYDLGRECYESEDYEQAAYWYIKAAEQGESIAQYSIAYCYYNGHTYFTYVSRRSAYYFVKNSRRIFCVYHFFFVTLASVMKRMILLFSGRTANRSARSNAAISDFLGRIKNTKRISAIIFTG